MNFNKKYFLGGILGAVLVLPFGFALSFGQTYGSAGNDDFTGTFFFLLPSTAVLAVAFVLSILKRK